MAVYTDNFGTGAGSTDLSARGNTSGGWPWAKVGGTNVVRSNTGGTAAITNAGTTAQGSGYTVPSGVGADQYAKAVRSVDASAVGVGTRLGSTGSGARGYFMRHSAGATVLYRLDPGLAPSIIQNIATGGLATDVIGLESVGSNHRMTRNGAYVAVAWSDATYATGLPGVLHSTTGSGITFDDFEGGDMPSSGTTVTVTAGTLTYAGQAIDVIKARTISATPASLTYAGQAITVVKARVVAVASALLTYVGQLIRIDKGGGVAAFIRETWIGFRVGVGF